MAIEKFNVVLTAYQDLTPTVRHFHFVRADGLPLSFIPGQFLSFLFEVSGETKRRSYSIASAPGSLTLELSVAYVPGGLASEILFGLKPGDALKVLGPAGRLILADAPIKRHILVGTGTGMAPYRSMLPALEERLEAGESVVVLEGVQYRKDALYIQEFMSSLGQYALAKFCLCKQVKHMHNKCPPVVHNILTTSGSRPRKRVRTCGTSTTSSDSLSKNLVNCTHILSHIKTHA